MIIAKESIDRFREKAEKNKFENHLDADDAHFKMPIRVDLL